VRQICDDRRHLDLRSWKRGCSFALLILLCLSSSSSSTFYEVREDETGWTTGYRRSMSASFELSGFALGDGTYRRYTEIDVNDVRMREQISAKNGTLDTEERIALSADDTTPWESELVKFPGGQDYTLTVNETWPASLTAEKSTDYVGLGISDREVFGNNLDYVGSQHLYATDYRKDRTCDLDLNNTWFEALLNDTTNTILKDLFQPAKTTEYDLDSYSTGLVILKYRQSSLNRGIAGESEERYDGTFNIQRHISMLSPGRNDTESEVDWLECCVGDSPNFTQSQSYECIFFAEGAI
jgi:hypothetical protein